MSTLKTTNIAHPSSASNNIVLDSSGNVVLQAGTAAAPALQPTGDTNTGVLFPATDTVAVSTGGTERVRIPSNGFTRFSNTGAYTDIATLSHGFRSDQSDWTTEFIAANASPYGIHMQYTGAAPNNTGNEFIQCSDTSAVRAIIRSNGGLANFSANNANLSDRNAKKDINPAADTWDCIKEWEIVNYRYKDQPDDADLNLGVIAQQVAESCPEVITVFQEAKDDQPEKLGVKEQQMYWMAIKALQEAQVRIEALEAEVAALKAA